MNKKIFSLIAIAILLSGAFVTFVPASEARSIDEKMNGDVTSGTYQFCKSYNVEYKSKLITKVTSGVYAYPCEADKVDQKMNEIKTALKNGTISDVKDGFELIQNDVIAPGSYVFLMTVNQSHMTLVFEEVKEKQTEQPRTFRVESSDWIKDSVTSMSLKLSTGQGDSVKVDISVKEKSDKVGVFIISKTLNYLIELNSNSSAISQIEGNKKEVLGSSILNKDEIHLEFSSANVTEYYLMFVSLDKNDFDYNSFKTEVKVSGLSDTMNPLPFAIVILVLSIAVLGAIIYFAKRKVI